MFHKNNLGDEIDYQNLRRSKEYRPLGEDYREGPAHWGPERNGQLLSPVRGCVGFCRKGSGTLRSVRPVCPPYEQRVISAPPNHWEQRWAGCDTLRRVKEKAGIKSRHIRNWDGKSTKNQQRKRRTFTRKSVEFEPVG